MRNRRLAIVFLFAVLTLSVFAFGQQRMRPPRVTDPVCGLRVVKDPELTSTYKGKTFYFCSHHDRDAFRKNPAKYLR